MTQSMENELTVRIEAPAEIIMVTPLDLFVRDLIQQFPAFSKSEGLVDMLELASMKPSQILAITHTGPNSRVASQFKSWWACSNWNFVSRTTEKALTQTKSRPQILKAPAKKDSEFGLFGRSWINTSIIPKKVPKTFSALLKTFPVRYLTAY